MIILRDKNFSEEKKKIDKKRLATYGAGLTALGVGGANAGIVHGTYEGVKEGAKDYIKDTEAYKSAKAGEKEIIDTQKEVSKQAKEAKKAILKSQASIKDKIKGVLKVRKLEKDAKKSVKAGVVADKLANKFGKKAGLEYIAKHNKKNIALAAGGIATGSALVAKSLKDNKKK